jgi:signal transduction histidine kinase
LGLLAEYVESRNTVIYRKTETDAVVNLDTGQFYQACYQIVKNACDEMADEGKIYVTTETDGEYLKIKFRDTGKGVPESWKEKIFKPFVSRKKNKAGLGLTIAEKIIADHGGYIMVDSATGQGATFSIALPIVF